MNKLNQHLVGFFVAVKIANVWGADLLLSIHINATPSGYGYEDWIYDGAVSVMSIKGQNVVNNEVVRTSDWRNRGKKRGNLQVLRDSKMAAILTESGFVENQLMGFLIKLRVVMLMGLRKHLILK